LHAWGSGVGGALDALSLPLVIASSPLLPILMQAGELWLMAQQLAVIESAVVRDRAKRWQRGVNEAVAAAAKHSAESVP